MARHRLHDAGHGSRPAASSRICCGAAASTPTIWSTQLAEALRSATRADCTPRFEVAGTRLASVDFRARLRALAVRLDQRSVELGVRIERVLVAKRQRLDRLRLQLEERSPLRVLERGYAICYDAAGNVVHAADDVAVGDSVRVKLARGRLGADVREKDPG